MSATLRKFDALCLALAGKETAWGSLTNAVREVTIAGGTVVYNREFVFAADERRQVWQWSDTGGFEFLAIIPLASGLFYGAHRIDQVTSESNQTPANANGPANHWSCSCFAWKGFDLDRMYFHATAATHVGYTAGLPTMWSDGAKQLGVCSKVDLWNPGTTTARVGVLAIQ